MRDLTPAQEVRAVVRAAKSLWSTERARWRNKSGEAYGRFTDRRALLNLGISCERAQHVGEWRDIEAAIRAHAANPDDNPWYLDKWTREQYGLRREAERLHDKMAERDHWIQAGRVAKALVEALRP